MFEFASGDERMRVNFNKVYLFYLVIIICLRRTALYFARSSHISSKYSCCERFGRSDQNSIVYFLAFSFLFLALSDLTRLIWLTVS